jgi:thioredoxin 1
MPGTEPVVVGDSNFKAEVEDAKGLSIVDFWAEWCGPCKMIAPILHEMAGEYAGKVRFCKLDVDSNRNTALRFNIRSIPTLLFFKDGKVVEMVIGVKSKKELSGFVEKHLS